MKKYLLLILSIAGLILASQRVVVFEEFTRVSG